MNMVREGAKQLTLDLPHAPRLEEEDFLVGPSNETAFETIESWPHWHHPVLRLEGPEGSGKTHLAHIWSRYSHAWVVCAKEITTARVPELIAPRALVIEDVDQGAYDETAMFHLLNLARDQHVSLLITARKSLHQWGIQTPDLLSRLRLAPVVGLGMPDDMLFRAVLVKLFFDRQLIVNTRVIEYLAMHLDRSFTRAQQAVAQLDAIAMGKGRAITRALASDYVQALQDTQTLFNGFSPQS
jgi:chromosomal replication initiation ATPase DnaA